MANAVMRWNTHYRFAVLPWQSRGLPEQVGLTEQQCMDAAWFVAEDGRQFRGAAAINESLRRLGGLFVVAAFLYRIPGLRQIEDRLYEWVAHNRWRMPGSSAACAVKNED